MSLTKGGLTKTKTKSLTKTAGSFPAGAWQYDMEYCIEMPRFFESAGWQELMLGRAIGPPPGPEETAVELRQLLEMQADTEERKRRRREIKEEANTYDPLPLMRPLLIPPGGGGFPATYTMIHGIMVLGKIVAVHFKNRFGRARPAQVQPLLRPLIDTPGHPAYPSGHSLQYHLLAKALTTIVRSHEIGEQLFEIAWRVAENREWAGLHYRSDSVAGRDLAYAMFPVIEETYRLTLLSAAREWV
jgi:hypothetical protein